MKKQVIVILALMFACTTSSWGAIVDHVYLVNADGDFYRINAVDYSEGSLSGMFPNATDLAVTYSNEIVLSAGNLQWGGTFWIGNGDPFDYDGIGVGGWGNIVAISPLPSGKTAFIRSDGVYAYMNADLSGWEYLMGYGDVSVITTLADGSVAWANPTIGTIYVGPGTSPISYHMDFDGGWGTITAMAGMLNGDIVAISAEGGAYVITKEVAFVAGVGGWGDLSAVTVLTDGRIAIGNTAGGYWILNTDLSLSVIGEGGLASISAMASLSDGNFVVANTDGGVYFIDATDGSIAQILSGYGVVVAMDVGPAEEAVAQCGDALHEPPIGDIAGAGELGDEPDCIVDIQDFAAMAAHWLEDTRP